MGSLGWTAAKWTATVQPNCGCAFGTILPAVTPAFSEVPNKADKIRSGYITPAFLGAHKWAEFLRNPCILGGPQQRGQNQNWLYNSAFAKQFHDEGWGKKREKLHPSCPVADIWQPRE